MTLQKIKFNYHLIGFMYNYKKLLKNGQSDLYLEEKYTRKAFNHGLRVNNLGKVLNIDLSEDFKDSLDDLQDMHKILTSRIDIKDKLSEL